MSLEEKTEYDYYRILVDLCENRFCKGKEDVAFIEKCIIDTLGEIGRIRQNKATERYEKHCNSQKKRMKGWARS